jgi:hypothetical protein
MFVRTHENVQRPLSADCVSRRDFLTGLGAAALCWTKPQILFASVEGGQKPSHEEIEQLLKPLFAAENPAMFELAVSVYEHSIFGRMQPAEPPLKHPWLIPGGIYVGQWLWDTTFLTDLLAIVPGQQEFIRGIYQNFWDSQERWAAAKPEYARGMVANFIAPDSGPKGFSGLEWADVSCLLSGATARLGRGARLSAQSRLGTRTHCASPSRGLSRLVLA